MENSQDYICYSSDDLKKWEAAGLIPQDIINRELARQKESKMLHNQAEVLKEKGFPQEDVMAFFLEMMPRKTLEEAKIEIEGIKFFLDHKESLIFQCKHLLSKGNDLKQLNQGLFNEIDVVKEFGIVNCISNSLYHLTEILKTMEISEIYQGLYEAKSSVKNSNNETISLTYTFQATTEEESKAVLKKYQSSMATKGLKVWIAHWITANKLGRVEYSCPMVDIMKMAADEKRKAFFSVKEKEEHWAFTKMLSMSKLSRERKVKKKGHKKEIIQWIEQPLIEILGGEKEMIAEDKYPNTIAIRVLMPKMNKKGFAPIVYKSNTALMNPDDVLLSFWIQTRAGQRQRGSKPIHCDWDFIFESGNLQATALSNPRMAKVQARKKMDRLQKGEIIDRWEEEPNGVCVTPKKRKEMKLKEIKEEST